MTAELALALPVVVLLLAALLDCGQALLGKVRCVDAARGAARAAARGEPDAAVRHVAAALAPPGAVIVVNRAGDTVRVEVSARVEVSGPTPGLPVRCVAVALAESS